MTLKKGKFNIKIWKVRKPSVWNAAKHSINRTISYQDDPVQCTFILSREGSWWKPKFKVYSSNLEDEKNPQWLLRRIIRLGLEFGVYYEFGLPGDLRSPKQPRTFTSEIYMEGGLIIWIILYLKLLYKKTRPNSCTKRSPRLNGGNWILDFMTGLHKMRHRGILAARKGRENKKMKRKWR